MRKVSVTLLAVAAVLAWLTAAHAASAERMFVGRIAGFDPSSRMLSIKGSAGVVTFDATNITVSGYRTPADIRKGDVVGVRYTVQGVRVIRRASAGLPTIEAASPSPRQPEVREVRRAKVPGRRGRRPAGLRGQPFDRADLNRDGKITPVELSVVIPDITMTRFRDYDKDGNGCLSRAEFRKALEDCPQRGNPEAQAE